MADATSMTPSQLLRCFLSIALLLVVGCHSHDDGPTSAVDALGSSVAVSTASGVVADDVDASTITVVLLGNDGSPLVGWTVTPSISGSGNSLAPPSGVTDATGTFQAVLTSTTAEVKTVAITVSNGETVVLVEQPSIEFIGDASNVDSAASTVTADPGSGLLADDSDVSTVTVTVLDMNGNRVPGAAVQLAASGTGNTLTQPVVTNAMGVTTGTITSTVEELKTITATVDPGGTADVLTQQALVVFGMVSVDGGLSSVTVTPDFGILANGSDTANIVVTLRDQVGDPFGGQPVSLSVTGGSNVTTPATGTTDANGVFNATLTTTLAGVRVVEATANPGGSAVVLGDTPSTEFAWPVPGRWFVRTTGSDSNDGMSAATAFLTLGAAAMAAQPGETVYVGAGTYAGGVDLTVSGTPGDPITWIADSLGTLTNDAGEVIIDAGGGDYGFGLVDASDITIDGFSFVGAGNPLVGAVDVSGASDRLTLTRSRIYGNALGVRIAGASGATIEDNVISGNSGTGVSLEAGASSAGITNNLIYGNGGSGLSADGASAVTVNLNTFYLNTNDQLIALGGSSVTATDNIVADGLADGLEQAGVGTVLTSTNNDSFGNVGMNWQGLAQDASDISVDPLFEDPDGADNLLGGADSLDDRLQVDGIVPSQTLDSGSAAATTLTLASGDNATDRTTRSDDVLDGEAPDGATVNMGYHFRPLVPPLAEIPVDDGRLFYGEGASSRPRVRDWNDSGSSWAAEAATAPAETRIQYAIHEQSIITDGEEYLVIQSTDGTVSNLEMVTWTGEEWRREWTNSDISVAHADKRGFDFGFEQSSSHGLLVQSNNTETPVYRTRVFGQWSDPIPMPLNDGGGTNPDPNTGVVLWVELIEKSGSDEITLMYADVNSDLVAIVWDGTQWLTNTATTLELDVKTNPISGFVHSRAFDGAYESLSGDFIATWGQEGGRSFLHSQRLDGDTTFSVPVLVVSMPGLTHYCDLAAEPGTDRVAAGFYDLGDGTERLSLATWDGAAWQDIVEIDAQILDVNDMGQSDSPGELAWLGTTGQAVCIYPDNETETLDWASWTSAGGWVLGTDLAVPGKGTGETALLRSFPNQDRVLAVFSGSNGGLYSATFDGTTWTLTNAGAPLETDLSTIGAAPFSFAFER